MRYGKPNLPTLPLSFLPFQDQSAVDRKRTWLEAFGDLKVVGRYQSWVSTRSIDDGNVVNNLIAARSIDDSRNDLQGIGNALEVFFDLIFDTEIGDKIKDS